MISSIKHTVEDNVRYQGKSGTIALDNRTPELIEEMWKTWVETLMWEKIEVLSDGAWIAITIRKENRITFFDW